MPWLEVPVGQRLYVRVKFTKAPSVDAPTVREPADPTSAVLTAGPLGAEPELEFVWPNVAGSEDLVRDAVGDFHAWVTPDVPARWEFSVASTGNVEAADVAAVMVREATA